MTTTKWGLRSLLARAEVTGEPDGANIVSLPRSYDVNGLCRQIRAVNGELIAAQCDRGRLDLAFEAAKKEYAALAAESEEKEAEIAGRLRALQTQLAEICKEHGLQVIVGETRRHDG